MTTLSSKQKQVLRTLGRAAGAACRHIAMEDGAWRNDANAKQSGEIAYSAEVSAAEKVCNSSSPTLEAVVTLVIAAIKTAESLQFSVMGDRRADHAFNTIIWVLGDQKAYFLHGNGRRHAQATVWADACVEAAELFSQLAHRLTSQDATSWGREFAKRLPDAIATMD